MERFFNTAGIIHSRYHPCLIITRLVKEIINVYEQINVIFGGMQLFFEDMIERVNRLYISLPKTISDTVDQYFAEAASSAKRGYETPD